MKFFLGLILTIVGFYFVWKTPKILSFFGRVDWAEKNMRLFGGTRMFYNLVGIVIILTGFAMMTGLAGGVAQSIAGFVFGV